MTKSLTLLAVVGLLVGTAARADASPITLVVNQGPGGGTASLPFSGQLTSASLTLDLGNAAPSTSLGSFTLEVNGIALGYAVRSYQSPWTFTLTNPMLAAVNQAGFFDVRLDFGGTYNAYGSTLLLQGEEVGSVVPEPGTLVLFGLGLLGVATAVRRRRLA